MATTTNFGWETPDDTDLVKDGAAAMRTLGNSIDASFVDLKGGTTGQVLSKNSNTDLDFTWVTSDDANAIQNSIINAKGDLIVGSANDTPSILSVSSDGSTLVADSSATTGLRWQNNYAAGKNKIINGDFSIWQRGTTFSTGNGAYVYTADRWLTYFYGNNTTTVSQQAFTAGTAPVSGYESQYFLRVNSSNNNTFLAQRIEDVRTFAGQTVTISFWAKVASGVSSLSIKSDQNFGSGGSAGVTTNFTSTGSVTTSWARYSYSLAIPSISGKTIGSSSYLEIGFYLGAINNNFDIWGVQLEAGNVATAFQTATGTLAGELAACQRYYFRMTGDPSANYPVFGTGFASTSGNVQCYVKHPQTMRIEPTILDYSVLAVYDGATIIGTPSSVTLQGDIQSKDMSMIDFTKSGSFTQFRPYSLIGNANSAAYVGLSAEL